MLAIRVLVGVAIALGSYTALRGADLPILEVEAQPMKAQAKRVAAALQVLGQPLTQQQQQALDAAVAESDDNQATNAIQKLFDSMALAMVHINPEQRVKVERGPAAAQPGGRRLRAGRTWPARRGGGAPRLAAQRARPDLG